MVTPVSNSTKLNRKIDDVLIELGVGLRPVMQTTLVRKAFNKLRADIGVMLDLQKHVAEKEYHLQILRDQKLQFLKGSKPDSTLFSSPTFNKNLSKSIINRDSSLGEKTALKSSKKRLASTALAKSERPKKKKKE